MTDHYNKGIEEITADEIWGSALRNKSLYGSFIPHAYGNFSEADGVAYDCWRFLWALENGKEITIEGFLEPWKEGQKKEKFKELLAEIVRLYNEPLTKQEEAMMKADSRITKDDIRFLRYLKNHAEEHRSFNCKSCGNTVKLEGNEVEPPHGFCIYCLQAKELEKEE